MYRSNAKPAKPLRVTTREAKKGSLLRTLIFGLCAVGMWGLVQAQVGAAVMCVVLVGLVLFNAIRALFRAVLS